MPNRKSKKAERQKASKELEDNLDVDFNFEELQELQDKLYGSASSKCGNVECKNHGSDTAQMHLQCSRCKGQKYCNAECQRADWNRHKYFCNSFTTSKIGVNKLRDKMSFFLQLFMSFPEHVADLTLHVRGLAPEERGGHCSIHFNSSDELRKWTKVLESQQLVELSRIVARTMFYPEDKARRLRDAYERSAIHREWIDHDARLAFDEFLMSSLQWDDEEGIMSQFRAAGVELGPSGMVLGISCIVNPADGSQTNILTSFIIKDPPIPPEDRKPRELVSLGAAMPDDEEFQCPVQ